jgi:hypothetical protein
VNTSPAAIGRSVLTPEKLEAALNQMDAETLGHLGSILLERARLRRRLLTVDEAETAVNNAPLTPGWERSRYADVGRVRIATRILIQRRWHPEQIAHAMGTIALRICPEPGIAVEAIAAGIADAHGMVRP